MSFFYFPFRGLVCSRQRWFKKIETNRLPLHHNSYRFVFGAQNHRVFRQNFGCLRRRPMSLAVWVARSISWTPTWDRLLVWCLNSVRPQWKRVKEESLISDVNVQQARHKCFPGIVQLWDLTQSNQECNVGYMMNASGLWVQILIFGRRYTRIRYTLTKTT